MRSILGLLRWDLDIRTFQGDRYLYVSKPMYSGGELRRCREICLNIRSEIQRD